MKSKELRICMGTVYGNATKEKRHCVRGKSEELRVKSEEYKFKEFDGITLISLIITIIILIILAGVAINLSIGENGIFTKTKEGSEKYKIAQIRETVELGILDVEMSELNRGNEVTIELVLQELLDNKIFESIDKEAKIGYVGEYEVKLKYNENEKIVIEYIQKGAGIRVTYTLEPSTYTNKEEVNILLKVQGKVKSVSKPDGKEIYLNNDTEEINYIVPSNGIYKFIIENTEGKIIEKNVIVDIIDTLPPKDFEITAKATRTGEIIITANAEDAEANETNVKSGIERYEYYLKLETESEYTKYDINKIEGLPSGIYEIYAVAYDKAKNSSTPTKKIEVEIEEWIEIWNEQDLRNMANDLTKNYILMADIELTSDWTAMGNDKYSFKGKLDGNYHKISKLKMNNAKEGNKGLFRKIYGKVSNLNLEGEITGGNCVGILTGQNYGIIENVKVTGTIKGEGQLVGGLIGYNTGGTIKRCYSNVEVEGTSHVGGLVGSNISNGIIENSYSEGIVKGHAYVGGLIGYIEKGSITNTCTLARVLKMYESSYSLGGLIGYIYNEEAIVTNSYWSPEIAGIQTNAQGTALTLTEMQTQSSYENWDFTTGTVWKMEKEYPELIFNSKLNINQ